MIDDDVSAKGLVVLINFEVRGWARIRSNSYESITLCGVRIRHDKKREETLGIEHIKGKTCLLLNCEILGGGDSLFINGTEGFRSEETAGFFCNRDKIHLKRSTVRSAASEGIFANDSFIIEHSIVDGCGWYGVKSNNGYTPKGRNTIQTNTMKPNAGLAGMGGMFDGPMIPMSAFGGQLFGGRRSMSHKSLIAVGNSDHGICTWERYFQTPTQDCWYNAS